ncbi:hypothetical protein PP175_06430 [Aneurinibacillus sp. Ricciae_BoGa-3]|uniref:hypothetical protein n=1 Tax=Aneurinibacillus sp. Ricciae_BoGa-3 TaxID=3022697 RepID=UPI0023413662|nr:hypothetical protein [Aneurinibacillus sp. Ricciae_BoGa-3]WCK55577.1 hypothetical protein PP175_06430 [Aneurinibacillus sp. Ricciae_BoGa-3]
MIPATGVTTTVYMMQSGKILLDTYGESFGYLEEPYFLRIPVKEVEIATEWIYGSERGVIYISKDPGRNPAKEEYGW